MFNLTLRDHLQLTFTEIIKRHNAHAAKAQSRARWGRRLRGSEALLVGAAAIASIAAAFGQGGQPLVIVAALCAGAALIVLLVNLTFDFEGSARSHAASGGQLWGLRERYRALLSDLHEGVVSVAEARLRRDRLIDELKLVYDTASVIHWEGDAPQAPAPPEEAAPKPPVIRSA